MKQALLILQEASSKELEMSKAEIESTISKRFPDMIFKAFDYQFNHPEEVSYHIGRMVQFVSRQPNGGPEPEQLSEEQKTWREEIRAFWEMAKPELKKLGKEIWYTKKQLEEMEKGKKPESRISSSSVKFKGKEENGKENIQA